MSASGGGQYQRVYFAGAEWQCFRDGDGYRFVQVARPSDRLGAYDDEGRLTRFSMGGDRTTWDSAPPSEVAPSPVVDAYKKAVKKKGAGGSGDGDVPAASPSLSAE